MTKVGFIGLGIMGKPMAAHLIDGGRKAVVSMRLHSRSGGNQQSASA